MDERGSADVFQLPAYTNVRMRLIQTLDMSEVRIWAEGCGLITSMQVDRLSNAFPDRLSHNRELFRMMEVGGKQALQKFSRRVLAVMGEHFQDDRATLDQLFLDGALDYERLRQSPTLFGSSKAEPVPGAAAQAHPDVELRLKDPWEQTAYKSSYPSLVSKMDPFTVGPQCFAMNLIISSQKNPLTRLQASPVEHNQKLLECVEKLDRKGFAKFREILRFSNSTNALDACIKKLDTIGPDPMEKVWFELRKEFSKGGS